MIHTIGRAMPAKRFDYFSLTKFNAMKKIYSLLIASILFVSACKKSSDTDSCNVPSFSVGVADKQIVVNVTDNFEEGYDVEYGTAGFTQGSGTVVNFTSAPYTIPVSAYGGYDVFVRKKCTGGSTSAWSTRNNITVDGSTTTCDKPANLNMYGSTPPRFEWYGYDGNFFDVEYGPTGFTIGNGTRIRTNLSNCDAAIMHYGITYDFYVRANCGGNAFSAWSGPYSYYAAQDYNISVPCTAPTNLYAYKINSQEINYTAVGHGNTGYEIAFSTSGSSNNGNILTTSSANGTVGSPGGFSGTYYFWIRGKCDNGSFTSWVVSQVQ
jgi:hypothetical protein